ncbi:MAG: SpoIVB peptidase S55 domain-containing protein [Vicinamibacteraceae bacterium]
MVLAALAGAWLALVPVRASAPPDASKPFMPVSEVRPGMVGTGVSVFQGTTRTEFRVQVVGVLENVSGPRRRLILVKLDGGPLAQAGVVAGMSGSPVYIEGRLVGAVSYALGLFAKEPIAGVTPIEEMTEATARGVLKPVLRPAAARRALVELPTTREALAAALRDTFDRLRPFAQSPEALRALGLPAQEASRYGLALRPIATPLTLGGFSGEAEQLLRSAFSSAGFMPVTGQPSDATATEKSRPLQPGDPIGLSLIRGDLSLGASGTVTYVDKDRVYAFGHPFLNLGPVDIPMTRSYVHTVLPSLMASTKIDSMGDVIGTVRQDRATAIAGTLGPGPQMVPLTLTLESEQAPTRTFRFDLVNDQLLTSLLTFATVSSTLQSYEREFGAATFTVRGKAQVAGHGEIELDDVFSGDTSSTGAAMYVAGPVNALLRNEVAPVEIGPVTLTITSTEQPRTARIERIWVDNPRPRAGETVRLHVLTRSYRGEELARTLTIAVPEFARGTLTLLVADAQAMASVDGSTPSPQHAESIDQMIRVFNEARRNNRVYVRLMSPSPGAVVNGRKMPALPPSVMAVLNSERNSSRVSPLQQAPLGEWEIATQDVVSGTRKLSLTVREP